MTLLRFLVDHGYENRIDEQVRIIIEKYLIN